MFSRDLSNLGLKDEMCLFLVYYYNNYFFFLFSDSSGSDPVVGLHGWSTGRIEPIDACVGNEVRQDIKSRCRVPQSQRSNGRGVRSLVELRLYCSFTMPKMDVVLSLCPEFEFTAPGGERSRGWGFYPTPPNWIRIGRAIQWKCLNLLPNLD